MSAWRYHQCSACGCVSPGLGEQWFGKSSFHLSAGKLDVVQALRSRVLRVADLHAGRVLSLCSFLVPLWESSVRFLFEAQ